MNLEDYQELDKIVKDLQKDRDKASGVLEQLKKELWKQFKCRTIKEAETVLKDRLKKQETMDKKLNMKLSKLKKNYPNLFEGD